MSIDYRGYSITIRHWPKGMGQPSDKYYPFIKSRLGYELRAEELRDNKEDRVLFNNFGDAVKAAKKAIDNRFSPAPMTPPTDQYVPWSKEDYLQHGLEHVKETNPELLDRQEQGSVIEKQAQRIEELTAALHTALTWTDELVKERDAKIARFKEFTSFADYWTVMNEEGGE